MLFSAVACYCLVSAAAGLQALDILAIFTGTEWIVNAMHASALSVSVKQLLNGSFVPSNSIWKALYTDLTAYIYKCLY